MSTEQIGVAIFAMALLVATAQCAFAWGRQVGTESERQLADRRINGVLAYENKRRPKNRKNKLKAARKSRVGSLSICV